MKKRKRAFVLAVLIAAVSAVPITGAFADHSPTIAKAEENGEKVTTKVVTTTTELAANEESEADITVVIPPKRSAATTAPETAPEAETEKKPLYLFPSSVYETQANGGRQIIKTYTLSDGENPYDISRESFEREGWFYELSDITKTETALSEVVEHKETVTLGSDTNDTEAVIKLLAPNMEHRTEDGFYGLLALDISSVKVETAGVKTSSFTKTATREYPGLASNDVSLLPKEITDGGRTYTLESVDWRPTNTVTADYDDTIAESYTAVASYTRTATSTSVTGYTVTADYIGEISRLNPGGTIYTACFLGAKLSAAPVVPAPDDADGEAAGATLPAETPPESPSPAWDGNDAPTPTPASEENEDKSGGFPVLSAILFVIGLASLAISGAYTMIGGKNGGGAREASARKGILANFKSVFGKKNDGGTANADADDDADDDDEDDESDDWRSLYREIETPTDTPFAAVSDGDEICTVYETNPSEDDADDDADDEPGGAEEKPPDSSPGSAASVKAAERAKRNQRLIKEAAYAEKILQNEGVNPEKLKEILAEIFRTGDAKAVLDRHRKQSVSNGSGEDG
jgi:hypothetical protein